MSAQPRSTPPPPGHKRLTINLREEDHQALKVRAAEEGRTIRELIEEAVSGILKPTPLAQVPGVGNKV